MSSRPEVVHPELSLQLNARPAEKPESNSFFLSRCWLTPWIATSGLRPLLLVAKDRGHETPWAYIGGPTADRTIALNETGDPALDVGYIEYNGLFSSDDDAASIDAVLRFLLAARRDGPLRKWRRLQLSGVSETWVDRCRAAGLLVRVRNRQRTYALDLAALRDAGSDVLSSLSGSTRQQLRRSRRLYEAQGGLTLSRVAIGADSEIALAELRGLHQARWTAAGHPGAFAAPRFDEFVRHLLAEGQADGSVEILRIAAGRRTIGLLLNFVWHGRVMNYLSGFTPEADNRLKPGLVSHLLAMEHHLERGAIAYDLLAGDARYKAALAAPHKSLVWLTARPRTPYSIAEELVSLGQRALTRAVKLLRRR